MENADYVMRQSLFVAKHFFIELEYVDHNPQKNLELIELFARN